MEDAYSKYYEKCTKAKELNEQVFDKTIFTASMASLGFFTTFVSAFDLDINLPLKICFFLLILTVGLVIISFLLSNASIDKALERAFQYYINENEEALNKPSLLEKVSNKLNYLITLIFFIGITIGFYQANAIYELNRKEDQMKKGTVKIHNGINAPKLIKKGVNAPTIKPSLSSNTQAESNNSQATNQQSSDKTKKD